MNYNLNLSNQQKTNEFISEINLVEKKNKRKKELEKIFFNNSSILRSSPRPVKVYDEKNNSAKKSLFFSFSALDGQLNKKFVYLTEKMFPIINSKTSGFDYEGAEFSEIISEDEKAREKIENIVVKEFAQNLERIYLAKKLCQREYQPENIKNFKELNTNEPQLFFDNLFKYIDKLGDTKDILIIANHEICRLIKKHDINKVLERSVSNILETTYLKNNIKLIIVSQKGLLIPYWVDRYYPNWKDDTFRIEFHYNIDLIDNNPILIFKEEENSK